MKYLAGKIPLDLNLLKGRYERELQANLGDPDREDITLRLRIEAIEEERDAASAGQPEMH